MSPGASLPELPELLSELVARKSPSGEEAECAGYVEELLRGAGLDVERAGHTVVAQLAGSGGGPHLFLNSHLDTVPAASGWETDPWDSRWSGEGAGRRLVALGANDAKASVAAMLTALVRCARGPQPSGRVTLALTACEETTNAGMRAALELLAGERFDGAVTGEPTGLEVVRAQGGLAVLEARWSGRACHAAHVARVEHSSALHLAAADLAAFGPYAVLEGEHPLVGASTLAPTVLASGERHNVVPDAARAVFDGRLAPGRSAAECAELMRARMPRAEVSVRSERLRPVETAGDHPLVRAALACAGRQRAIGSSTLSDMALLAGTPAVKCGPGETARSHTPGEYVLLSELEAGAAFYAALIPEALAALAASKTAGVP